VAFYLDSVEVTSFHNYQVTSPMVLLFAHVKVVCSANEALYYLFEVYKSEISSEYGAYCEKFVHY
jgi:hypothetical protein